MRSSAKARVLEPVDDDIKPPVAAALILPISTQVLPDKLAVIIMPFDASAAAVACLMIKPAVDET